MRARLSGLPTERLVLLLLAFAIATALWAAVRGGSRQIVPPGPGGTALRTVPVIPRLVGVPAEGITVRGVEVRPSYVTLAGPPEILEEIEAVVTADVEIHGARTDLVRTVDLRLPPGVRAIGTVSVSVRLGPATARWVVPEVRVVLEGLGEGLQAEMSPSAVAVEVEGSPQAVEALRPEDLRAVAQAAGLGPGTYRLRPQVEVPSRVRVLTLRPDEIRLVVRAATP